MTRSSILRIGLAAACVLAFGLTTPAHAQINVISVDCTPFVSPGPTSFGMSNTMGMSLVMVDTSGFFAVTEVTPQAFRALTAAQLAAFDLIAINNNPMRISDNCVPGSPGLGTTWHGVIGINSGGRVHLNSHDAARFKIIVPPGSTPFSAACPGCEPFAADDLILQAALWAGGGSQTGLMIFNDSARFGTVGGSGWNNAELNLPAAWGITDSDQFTFSPAGFVDGGYTDILPAFAAHPIYVGLTDARLAPNSVSSFAANIVDDSFHSVFGSFNAAIFSPTEVMTNVGIIDVGGFNATFFFGVNVSPPGPNGLAVSLIRDESVGACCTDGPGIESDCIVMSQADCALAGPQGGLYLGNGTTCAGVDCVPLVVTLDSVSAEEVSGGVLLRWTTALEIDTVGFRILRQERGNRAKAPLVVSGLIPAEGVGFAGASYEFRDASRQALVAEHYFLEDIDTYGRVTRHGPFTVSTAEPVRTRTAGH